MFDLMKKGAMMLLTAAFVMGLPGCSEADPEYNDVTPPDVVVAPNTLSGVITTIKGEAIANAKVSLSGAASASATTDAKGVYKIENVKAGSYEVTAEASGRQTKSGNLTVAASSQTQHLVWNAALASDQMAKVVISATQVAEDEVKTETLKGNSKAEILVEVAAQPNAVQATGVAPEALELYLMPIYDAEAALTKANEATLMAGSILSCNNKDAVINHPIDLTFNVDADFAGMVQVRKLVNNKWVAAQSRVEGSAVVVEADAFTAYGLFLTVAFSEEKGSEQISFDKSVWDNTFGYDLMEAKSAKYSYKMGFEPVGIGTSTLTALLLEKLVAKYGAAASTMEAVYPLNVVLPGGTKVSIAGTQVVSTMSASAKGATVSGKSYGSTSIVVTSTARDHTGGGSL